MATIKVLGGKPLTGSITIESNKNEVLPLIAATLHTLEICTIHNVPRSPDVLKMLAALREMGAGVLFNENLLTICCKNVNTWEVPKLVAGMQASILFVGPLLARFGKAKVPRNVGCQLGFRGYEGHIEYLAPFGITCTEENNWLTFEVDHNLLKDDSLVQSRDKIREVKHEYFTQALVTPTENLLMLLSMVTAYDVELSGIAQEPHVVRLMNVLKMMGVLIRGDHGVVKISGSYKPLKGFNVTLEPDHVDFYGTMVAGILTKGTLDITYHDAHEFESYTSLNRMTRFMQNVGISVSKQGSIYKVVPSHFNPEIHFPKAADNIWKLDPGPWPAFPVDSLPSFVVLACANRNTEMDMLISNWMYEDGMRYASVLKDLGIAISIENPQKVRIRGSESMFSNNQSVEVTCPDVIEGARAVFLAALARPGVTIIKNFDPLLRRSPNFLQKYLALGASIEIIA
jgi:UDP-N-acetylglucosamine 1-carboxyvinyltransferase